MLLANRKGLSDLSLKFGPINFAKLMQELFKVDRE